MKYSIIKFLQKKKKLMYGEKHQSVHRGYMIIDEYGLTGDFDLPIFSKASTINIYCFWNKIEIKKSILNVPPSQEKDPEQAQCWLWLLALISMTWLLPRHRIQGWVSEGKDWILTRPLSTGAYASQPLHSITTVLFNWKKSIWVNSFLVCVGGWGVGPGGVGLPRRC